MGAMPARMGPPAPVPPMAIRSPRRIALGATVLFTSLGGRTFAWDSPFILAMIAASVIGLVLFLVVETRADEPILPLSLFRVNTFRVFGAIGFVVNASLFGAVIHSFPHDALPMIGRASL